MGICSSKDTKSTHGGSACAAAKDSAGGVPEPVTPASVCPSSAAAAAGSEADVPITPSSAVAAIPEAEAGCSSTPEHLHKYKSAEKPARSALRPSLDVKMEDGKYQEAKSEYSRRSSSGMSTVGFSVSIDAPDAEGHKAFAGADSISLKKIVDIFYEKVVGNALLAPFFVGIDVPKLKRHQVRFMALAFGGKELVFEEDPNLNLRKVHYHLIRDRGLTLEHWEMFVALFDETMELLAKEIPAASRDAAKRSIRATRHYFVPIGEETPYTHQHIAALPAEAAEPGPNGAAPPTA